jgi:hypothetical protein
MLVSRTGLLGALEKRGIRLALDDVEGRMILFRARWPWRPASASFWCHDGDGAIQDLESGFTARM